VLALLLSATIAVFFALPLQAVEPDLSTPGYSAPDLSTQGYSTSGFSLNSPTKFVLGLHLGLSMPQAKGGLYGWLTNSLSFNKSDFRTPTYGFDFGIPFHPHFAAFASFDYNTFTKQSEYRHFVEDNGNSIMQTTTLSHASFVGTLRYYPRKMGEDVGSYAWVPARILPYIGAGVGVVHYDIFQYGNFVDEASPLFDIHPDGLTSNGSALDKHLAAGLDIAISTRFVANMEARYA